MAQILALKKRPDPALIKEFSTFGVALITDAMDRYGAMLGILPVVRGMKIAGPAITVQTYRADNLMVHVGLHLAQAGDILVVDAGGITNTGVWGGHMTDMALIKKLGGIVVDGAIRDSAEMITKGFSAFCKTVSPMGGHKDDPGSVNIAIGCGNVVVNAGDIIIGDDDGVAVIPQDRIDEVMARCRKIKENEIKQEKAMSEGKELFDLIGLPKQLEALGLKLPE
jgi:4-hydroxy-4-methyl-2-oxoglutarate aldolase